MSGLARLMRASRAISPALVSGLASHQALQHHLAGCRIVAVGGELPGGLLVQRARFPHQRLLELIVIKPGEATILQAYFMLPSKQPDLARLTTATRDIMPAMHNAWYVKAGQEPDSRVRASGHWNGRLPRPERKSFAAGESKLI